MDEPNATSVSTQPDEVAGRSEPRARVPQQLAISVRLTTIASANHLCGLVIDILEQRGHQVESIRVHKSDKPLAKYDRQRGER